MSRLVPAERPGDEDAVVIADDDGDGDARAVARRRDARERTRLRHAQTRALLRPDEHHDAVRAVSKVLTDNLDQRATRARATDGCHGLDLDPSRRNREGIHGHPSPIRSPVVVHVKRELLPAHGRKVLAGPAQRLPVPTRAHRHDRHARSVGQTSQRHPQDTFAV